MATAARTATPAGAEELAAGLRDADGPVRVRGGGTKLAWSPPERPPALELSTTGLDRIEHNPGDMTAVVDAGVPLARAQELFAEEGQMLAIDPHLSGAETVGGVVATADSGPLRQRHGAPRDLVLGVTVALPDGTLARAGGTVIKNVAGYDLGKLFTGSFGALGAILRVALRLHPLPPASTTVAGESDDPEALGRAALAVAHAPLEPQALDVRWESGAGALLARFAGAAPAAQAEAASALMGEAGLVVNVVEEDSEVWDAQRAAQRGPLVVKVSGLPTTLPALLRSADELGGSVVGRAGLGLSWVRFEEPAAEAASRLRRDFVAVVQDRPAGFEAGAAGVTADPGAAALMRRVKERFDPAGVCV